MDHKLLYRRLERLKSNPTGKLNISGLELTELPPILLDYKGFIKELWVYKNNLQDLPEWLAGFDNLKNINISNNKLVKLPNVISEMKPLEWLSISNNDLTELPDSLGNLGNMTHLFLSRNRIKALPNNFCKLKNLKVLDISSNALESIPTWFGDFHYLKKLSLTNNKITSLPDSIGNLVNLAHLHINVNPLADLPSSLAYLPKLMEIECDYSKLSDRSLFKRYSLAGVQSILRVQEKEKEEEKVKREVIEIAEDLRAAFLGYLSFFDDYVRIAKNKTIDFKASKHSRGILLEVTPDDELSLLEAKTYIVEFIGYLKDETVSVIENIIADRTEQEKKLLQIEINDLKREFEGRLERLGLRMEIENNKKIEKVQKEFNSQLISIIKDLTSGKNVIPAGNVSVVGAPINLNINNSSIAKSLTHNELSVQSGVSELRAILEELGIVSLVDQELSSVDEEPIDPSKNINELGKFEKLFNKLTKIISTTKTWLIDTGSLLDLFKKMYKNIESMSFPVSFTPKNGLLETINTLIENLSR